MAEVVATLDDYGRPAWIVVMVLGFILFWPIGLAILAYLLWSGRMGCGRHGEMSRWQRRMTQAGCSGLPKRSEGSPMTLVMRITSWRWWRGGALPSH